MSKMTVIQLLNKIANGEEVPKKFIWDDSEYYLQCNKCYKCDETSTIFEEDFILEDLNDEVEILEEEKKIPKKLPYYSIEKIQKAKNKDEWQEERITLLEKRVDDLHIKINEIIDYLKSKGE